MVSVQVLELYSNDFKDDKLRIWKRNFHYINYKDLSQKELEKLPIEEFKVFFLFLQNSA